MSISSLLFPLNQGFDEVYRNYPVHRSVCLYVHISCKFDTSLMDEQILMELHSCGIRPEDVHEGR